MSKKSDGCPFNHFGPCMEAKCKFFLHAKNLDSYCAILAAYTESMCANVTLAGLTQLITLLREVANIPEDALLQHHRLYEYQVLVSHLKRLCSSLSADGSVREQARANLDKALRILDILCEDEDENIED